LHDSAQFAQFLIAEIALFSINELLSAFVAVATSYGVGANRALCARGRQL
jgi:hypothetical protein